MDFDPSSYIDIFYEEADEYLETMTNALLKLEKRPQDQEALEEVFRGAHSFKGGAAAVGFQHISKFAHKMEDVLQKLRDKEIIINSSIVDTLFQSFDILKQMLTSLQSQEHERKKNRIREEASKMERTLEALKTADAAAEKNVESAVDIEKLYLGDDEILNAEDLLKNNNKIYEIVIHFEKDAPMLSARLFIICNNLGKKGESLKCLPDIEDNDAEVGEIVKMLYATNEALESFSQEIQYESVANFEVCEVTDLEKYRYVPGAEKIEQLDNILEVMAEQEDKIRQEVPLEKVEIKRSTLKVGIEKLDTLLNLVAELVINRGQALELAGKSLSHPDNKDNLNNLYEIIVAQGLIINQFQESIMTTRLVPVGQVFQRFPRIIRDLARDKGKDIRLEIIGEETELDKKIIDEIGEPLTHLVRNSIDHGIETKEEREKAGKPAQAVIQFSAYHESGNIIIEVKDDGQGIDLEKVKQKALERGLATEDELAKLSQKEILQFIFMPGFSTAEKISDISGRGVGMDVVRRKVELLNGELDVATVAGVGSTFTLKLPLTLAIIQALLVKVADEKFAIPISSVVETIRITDKDVFTVEGKGQVIKVRDDIITLLKLDELLNIKRTAKLDNDRSYVAVVNAGNHLVGLMVDKMISEQEIVIKSLDSAYKKADYLAGASILGDGTVCLILDPGSWRPPLTLNCRTGVSR